MRTISSDLRYTLRSLARARWFALGAALTFALGIGVNLAVFSAVDRILFRELPFEDPDRLMVLRVCSRTGGECSAGSFPDLLAEEARDALQHLGELTLVGHTSGYEVASTAGEVSPIEMTRAWPNLLRVLGVTPVFGRDVLPKEVREDHEVAFLSYEAWHRRFAGDVSIIGRPLGQDAQSPTVIGILPPGFVVPAWGMSDPRWEGIVLRSRVAVIAPIARLHAGSSREAAQDEVTAFVANLWPRLRSPRDPPDTPPPFIRVDRLGGVLFDMWKPYAWLVTAAGSLVLLMACVNLACLLLARGRSREYDAIIRTALGASPTRIWGAAAIEAGLVCGLGALVALGVLAWTSQALGSILPPMFARYMAGASDPRVIGAALLVALATALGTSVVAGPLVNRPDISRVLRRGDGAGRRHRLPGGRSLLAVESALGVVLVLGAALALRSFVVLATDDPGYEVADLYRVGAPRDPSSGLTTTSTDSLAQYREMLRAAASIPGVLAVTGGDTVMATRSAYVYAFAEGDAYEGSRMEIDAGFFAVVESRLIAGREFTEAEVATLAPVAMLNRTAVEQVWPGLPPEHAVGRVLTLPGEPSRTIIGVAPWIIKNRRGEAARPLLYVPLGTRPRSYSDFLVRMAPGATPPLELLRDRLEERVGPRLVRVEPVGATLDGSLPDPRFRAVLFGAFGLCALLLAAAGLYALASFEVAQHRYETGVRMALGASPRQIQRGIVFGSVRPVAAGVLAGGLCALWLGSFLQSYLYQTDAGDPWIFSTVAGVLLATAAAAAWLPARRAARTDPTVVLRAS
jgi:predicted permease